MPDSKPTILPLDDLIDDMENAIAMNCDGEKPADKRECQVLHDAWVPLRERLEATQQSKCSVTDEMFERFHAKYMQTSKMQPCPAWKERIMPALEAALRAQQSEDAPTQEYVRALIRGASNGLIGPGSVMENSLTAAVMEKLVKPTQQASGDLIVDGMVPPNESIRVVERDKAITEEQFIGAAANTLRYGHRSLNTEALRTFCRYAGIEITR